MSGGRKWPVEGTWAALAGVVAVMAACAVGAACALIGGIA